jgi:hypothetical protein
VCLSYARVLSSGVCQTFRTPSVCRDSVQNSRCVQGGLCVPTYVSEMPVYYRNTCQTQKKKKTSLGGIDRTLFTDLRLQGRAEFKVIDPL